MIGMMAAVLFLTQGQQVQVLGINLFALRFVELAGFARVMARREFSFSRLNRIDRSLIWLYAFTTIVFLLRSSDGKIYQVGTAVDAFLCYFTFRGLIGGMDDFRWFLRSFLLLLVPYVALVLFESFRGQYLFFSMDGLVYEDWIREGRLRCEGSFRHPSLLGTLGASFLPLYIGLALAKGRTSLAWLGICLCLLIVWASNSGGPANCAVVAVVGWLFWKLRTKMRSVRQVSAFGIVLVAIAMKAPIWFLLARASSVSGGDGWHRSYLIDVAFRNIGKWWLIGMPISETQGWFPYDLAVTGGTDITNQFIGFGLAAGLAALILFVNLLIQSFGILGKALAVVRTQKDSRPTELFLWGLGVMIAVHVVNWLGISYFDQTYVVWFLQLAAITNLSEGLIHSTTEIHAVETTVQQNLTCGERVFAGKDGMGVPT